MKGRYAIMAERGDRWTVFGTFPRNYGVIAHQATLEGARTVVRLLRDRGWRPNDARRTEPCPLCGRIKGSRSFACVPCQHAAARPAAGEGGDR